MHLYLIYAPEDAEFAKKLAEGLHPAPFYTQIHEWLLRRDDPLTGQIEKEAPPTDSLLAIVVSHRSADAPWLRTELDSALITSLEGDLVMVVPLIYSDCTLPPFLSGRGGFDFRGNWRVAERNVMTCPLAFKTYPAYQTAVISRMRLNPTMQIPADTLMEICYSLCVEHQIRGIVEPPHLDKTSFDLLLDQTLRTQVFIGQLFLRGYSFCKQSDLVARILSVRSLPYPEHRSFCIRYASSLIPEFEDLVDYAGAKRCWTSARLSDSAPFSPQLEERLLEIVSNLFAIGAGAGKAISILMGYYRNFREPLFDLAARTGEDRILYGLLREACWRSTDQEGSRRALEALAKHADEIPAVKRFLATAFACGDSWCTTWPAVSHEHIQLSLLSSADMFPNDLMLFFKLEGGKSDYPAVRQLSNSTSRSS